MEIFLIFIWMIFSISLELTCGEDECNFNLITPLYFYNKGMNWFGAYVCVILLGIISPAMFIFKILKWLFTVGR